MNHVQNNEKTGFWAGMLITLLGLALIFLPAILGADMMMLGYGLACIGLIVTIIGLITVLMFGLRVRTMDRILAGEEVLAHWTYDEGQGRQQVEREYRRSVSQNRAIYLVMVFWFVLIGGAIVVGDYLTNGEINWLFAKMFFSFLLILGAVAFLAPILWRRRASGASREVIIGRNGLVMNGALHTWSRPFNRLAGVEFREGSGEPALVLSIRYMSRIGVLTYPSEILIVPVPPGEHEAARQVVNALNAII